MRRRTRLLAFLGAVSCTLAGAVPVVTPPDAQALGIVYHTCGSHNTTLVGESTKYKAKTYMSMHHGCGRVSVMGWYYTPRFPSLLY